MSLESFISKWGGWTESYWFYKDSDDPIELRYDPKEHAYLLVTPEGLEKQDGVTTVVHIIDKSEALVPWGCKMMYQKLLRTMPFQEVETDSPDGTVTQRFTPPMAFEEFDKLVFEAKNAHTEKLEEAGEIGHIAHAWIENYIKIAIESRNFSNSLKFSFNTLEFLELAKEWQLANMPKDERSKNACVAALDWMSRHNVRWISTEKKIYSRKYKYAGTMDGLCLCDSCDNPLCCPEQFKDRLSVADWKTSNYLYLEYIFQTAAYEAAYEEEYGVDIKDRWIIRLGKDNGEFEPWHLEEHNFADDFGGFLDALDLVRRVRRINARIKEKKADIRAALKAERDAARAVQEALEKAQRAEAKAKKQKERLEALVLACTKSAKYKGKKKPSCKTGIDGGPCLACTLKYAGTKSTELVLATIADMKASGTVATEKVQPAKENVCTDTTSTAPTVTESFTTPTKAVNQPQLNSLLGVLVKHVKQPLQLPASTESQPSDSLTPVSISDEGYELPKPELEYYIGKDYWGSEHEAWAFSKLFFERNGHFCMEVNGPQECHCQDISLLKSRIKVTKRT